MPRSHLGVMLLAEVRTGVGQRLEGGAPEGVVTGIVSRGQRWSTPAWRDTLSLTLFIIAGTCENERLRLLVSLTIAFTSSVDDAPLCCLYGGRPLSALPLVCR